MGAVRNSPVGYVTLVRPFTYVRPTSGRLRVRRILVMASPE